MIALLAASSALAGDLLLSGGVATSPNVGSLIAPSWRAGWAGERLAVWGSAQFATFHLDLGRDFEPREIDAFLLRPRVGARYAFADRGPERLSPYVAGSAGTLVFGVSGDGDDVLEDENLEGRLPVALTGAGGLQVGLTEVLSVSTELGLDWENARYVEGRSRVTDITTWSTYAALYLDFHL